MASPVGDSYAVVSGGVIAAGCAYAPSWSPAAGEIKTISYAAGAHPNGSHGGAVLEEISPSYQSWNPAAPAAGPYGGTSGNWFFSSILDYCGAAFNESTRQVVCYGAGHSAFNVPAPFAFDLHDLTWKWLDTPLPIDGLDQIRANSKGVPPSQADIELYYPASQYNYSWGDWSGDYSGWPSGFGRPGKIQPNPGHSRAKLIVIPAASAGNGLGSLLWTAQGTGVLGGVNAVSSHLFSFDAPGWSRCSNQISSLLSSGSGLGIVHDPVSNKVFIAGESNASSRVGVLDVATKTWSLKNATNTCISNVDGGGAVRHESLGLFLLPYAKDAGGAVAYNNGVTFGMYACPLADMAGSGSFAWTNLTVTGAAWPLNGVGNNNYIGWKLCPADGCLYTVNGVNGSNKYWKMTPPAGDPLTGTWTVTEHTFSTGTLTSPGVTSKVYNRLQWDKRSRSFIWIADSINAGVQAFRPEGL